MQTGPLAFLRRRLLVLGLASALAVTMFGAPVLADLVGLSALPAAQACQHTGGGC